MNNWQPIETEPKDRRVLVWMGGRPKIACWNAQKYHSKPKPYWESEGNIGVMMDRESQPEWWMPVPEPPDAKQKRTDKADDGWIEWKGGDCPVGPNTRVHLRFADGDQLSDCVADEWEWLHAGVESSSNIVAYKIAK